MQTSKLLTTTLVLAGGIGAAIGAAILVAPIAFHATSGITLDGTPNLLSEMRASGGALLAASLLILAGAFVRHLRFTAAVIAVLLYLSYGFSRLFSMLVDGLPDTALLQIAAFEIFVGLICLGVSIRHRDSMETSQN